MRYRGKNRDDRSAKRRSELLDFFLKPNRWALKPRRMIGLRDLFEHDERKFRRTQNRTKGREILVTAGDHGLCGTVQIRNEVAASWQRSLDLSAGGADGDHLSERSGRRTRGL